MTKGQVGGLLLSVAGTLLTAQPSLQTTREVACFALVQESASSEGQNLFLHQMGFGPEALRAFAPSRFELGPGGFACHTEGVFGFESGTPSEVARSGGVILYQVSARVRSSPPPRAKKTVTVDIRLSDLAKTGDAVQPGVKAIELAAAKLGWRSGLAWILDMKWRGRGILRVDVALTP